MVYKVACLSLETNLSRYWLRNSRPTPDNVLFYSNCYCETGCLINDWFILCCLIEMSLLAP